MFILIGTTVTKTFEDLLKQKQWEDYPTFVAESQQVLDKEIKENVQTEKTFITELKESDEFKRLQKRKFDGTQLKNANDNLKAGNVVAIDGTISTYPLFSGSRCQIGVVAVNYIGEKIQKSFFVSEPTFREEAGTIIERLRSRVASAEDISGFALRGLMAYRERELGLEAKFKGRYKMFQGALTPFEMLTDLGRLHALRPNLKLLERLLDEKKCFSIISDSTDKEFYYLGLALEKGQYASIPGYTYGHKLANRPNFLVREKWEARDWEMIQDFIKNYAEKIKIGIIKVNNRPYLFNAHEEIFDLAAHTIAADSMLQREKGFPLLIDYADTLCSEYFSSSQFKKRMDWQLAKEGAFLTEAGERRQRKKR